jgi:hypothetical protein
MDLKFDLYFQDEVIIHLILEEIMHRFADTLKSYCMNLFNYFPNKQKEPLTTT